MNFDSIGALLSMEGHGIYVWPAYLVTITVIALLLLSPIRRRKRILQQVATELRREQRVSPVDKTATEAS